MPNRAKPRIVFISRTSGESARGVETFVHELGNRLSQSGLDITVIQNGAKIPGAKYQTISLGLSLSTSMFKFSLSALKKIPAGITVIVPVNGGWLALLTRAYSWINGSRLVITGHAGLGWDDLINLWCFPDVFVAQTQFQSQWAERRQPFVKKHIIPSGVDIAVFNPRVAPHKFDLPRPIILNVGALEPIKRQDLLIKAAAGLPVSVLLVGQGSREKELWALGRKYLGPRFQISQFDHQSMPEVYAACDLLAYPSSPWESFGLAILEAMSVGKPVVVSDDPIRREIIGTAGLTVDPQDSAAFAHLLSEALHKNWGQLPRDQARKFSWDKITDAYLKLFKEL